MLKSNHGAEYVVPNVEVIVRIARPRPLDDPIVGVTGRKLGHDHAKLGTLFEAFEDEIRTVPLPPFHALAVRAHIVFSLQPLGFERVVVGPLDPNPVVARVRLDPLLVLLRARRQGLFRDRVDPVDVSEEMDDVLLARQERQIALNDDAIETVVYKGEQAAKQLAKRFHRSSPFGDLA